MHTRHSSWHQIDAFDAALCLRFNRASRYRAIRALFQVVSRLGDGVFWYALMAVLPFVHGQAGLETSLRMLAAGVVGLLIYKWLKSKTLRPRPCHVHAAIRAGAAPLDQFSFPSGHTLHAVSFAWVACSAFPELAPVLVGMAALIGLSRPVLGLHYPGDVVAGAVIGMLLGRLAVCAL